MIKGIRTSPWLAAPGRFVGLTASPATRAVQRARGRSRQPASPVGRALAIFCTYHFVCLTWVFFRAASVADAMALLGRIGSLTVGLENITAAISTVLRLAAAALFVRTRWYTRAMEGFAGSPFYVHAAVLLLLVVAIQLLGGRAAAPFVYSRF